MYKDVTYATTEEGVGVITINLPKVRNALSVRAMQEMLDALNRAEDDNHIGAVMITGVGEAFCAGFHLREIPLDRGTRGIRDHFRAAALWWHQLLQKIVRARLPVLASVNGVAAGGGFGLALASDMAICVDTARFVCAWHGIGIANDTATSYSLARIVGIRRAMELMLTNRTMGAAEATQWGIVNRVYPADRFQSAAKRIAAELAAAPTHLQVMAKRRFHEGWMQPIEECTEREIENVLASVVDPHFCSRLEDFLRGSKADRPQVVFPE
jgi:2-(1,2-epoxy-1,2-dihydrophenyl)acetyl-CoA isomerase